MRHAGKVELRSSSDLAQFRLRREQHRHDQPGLGRRQRTGERLGAARVHHAGEHRLEPAAALQQSIQPMLRHLALQLGRGRHNLQHGSCQLPARRIGTLALENHEPLVRPFLPHDHLRRQDGVDRQGGPYLYRGRADGRSGSGQGRPDQRGQDRSDDPGRVLHVAGFGDLADIAESGGPGT